MPPIRTLGAALKLVLTPVTSLVMMVLLAMLVIQLRVLKFSLWQRPLVLVIPLVRWVPKVTSVLVLLSVLVTVTLTLQAVLAMSVIPLLRWKSLTRLDTVTSLKEMPTHTSSVPCISLAHAKQGNKFLYLLKNRRMTIPKRQMANLFRRVDGLTASTEEGKSER